jgi:hypothetical protein
MSKFIHLASEVTMKHTTILLAAASLLLGVASASGATQQDRDGCKAEHTFSNAKIIVEACTRVLDDAATSRSDRIAALIRRCRLGVDRKIDCDEAGKLDPITADGYQLRGSSWDDCDRGIPDYSEAIRLDPQAIYSYALRAQCFVSKSLSGNIMLGCTVFGA